MRYGVTVTALIDACDTGMVLDLPYTWSPSRSGSTPKMSQNDDFSFVRFLKVVKTLYESSTFTQLGRTVGSALNTGNAQKDFDDQDEETHDNVDSPRASQVSHRDDDNLNTELQSIGNGFLSMFCGKASAEPVEEILKKKKARDDGTLDSGEERHTSILEKMINCTLGEEVDELDDMSDCEYDAPTFSDREEDFVSEESFDDAPESRRHRGSRGDRGRSRGRRK
jgi:hypothetical protein